MRKVIYAILVGLALMTLAFWVLKLDNEHIYTARNDIYAYLSKIGLCLLFLAFAILVTISAYLSRKLRAATALLTGIAMLALAAGALTVVSPIVNVHSWTFTLLVVPLTMFLSGAWLFVVGAVRWTILRFRRPLPE